MEETQRHQSMTSATVRAHEREVNEFIANIGKRIRHTREQKEISRRLLSELSGVSQRYLAQLESGSGNISLALLYRIASALGRKPGWLMEDRSDDIDDFRILSLLQTVSPETRTRVIRVLESDATLESKKKRVCLIGLRGAGKSSLGRLLAENISWEFVELNRVIEKICEIPVSEIIALYGMDGYRQFERQALNSIIEESERLVLAASGGIVSEPDTFTLLLQNFHTIWVKASPEEHMERVRAQGDIRPIAGYPKAMQKLKSILASRASLYSQADCSVDTSGRTLTESLENMVCAYNSFNAADGNGSDITR